jgi:hypothetical protein
MYIVHAFYYKKSTDLKMYYSNEYYFLKEKKSLILIKSLGIEVLNNGAVLLQCVIIIDNYTLYAVAFHESVHEQKKSHKRTLCDRSFSLKTNLKRQFKKKILVDRSVINGKAGKAAALSKFSDTLTPSQSEGEDYAQPLIGLASPIIFRDYAPALVEQDWRL